MSDESMITVDVYRDDAGLFCIIKFPSDLKVPIPHQKVLSARGRTVVEALKNLAAAAVEHHITLPAPFQME